MERTLAYIVAFIVFGTYTIFFNFLGVLYYPIIFISIICLLFKGGVTLVWKPIMVLIFVCLLSILLNSVPSIFNSYERLLGLVMILILVSPFIVNKEFVLFRNSLFFASLLLSLSIVVLSMLFLLVGRRYSTGDYFQGITSHSMILGPLASISALYCIYQIIGNHYYLKKPKKKYFFFVCLFISIYCLFQTGSRSAVLALILGVLVFLLVFYRRTSSKFIRLIMMISLITAISFPVWEKSLDKLAQKNDNSLSEVSTRSRERLWNNRIREFKHSPLIGIGFCSVSIDPKSREVSANGKIETGSSWLSILSMTGLLGFCSILFIWISLIVKCLKKFSLSPLLCALILSLQVFWSVHMYAEGYIFASGSLLAFIVWLNVGMLYVFTISKKNTLLLQRYLLL